MSLAGVLGHDRIKRILAKALAEGRFPPALLLSGPEGVGKRTLALAAAEALVCERGGGAACGACSTCTRIARARETLPALRKAADERPDEPERRNFLLHPDLVLVEARRTATRQDIRIEQVREVLRQLEGRPFEARARVFVFNDAHALTEQAQNALLKGLEEPPATSHVMLVTAAPQALLPTIRSRVVSVRVAPISDSAVGEFLADPIVKAQLRSDSSKTPASELIRLAGGAPGRLLASASTKEAAQQAQRLLEAATSADCAAGYRVAFGQGAARARGSFTDTLDALEVLLHQRVRNGVSSGNEQLSSGAAKALEMVERVKEQASGNVNPQLLTAALVREMSSLMASR